MTKMNAKEIYSNAFESKIIGKTIDEHNRLLVFLKKVEK